jgi:hypothetical protein
MSNFRAPQVFLNDWLQSLRNGGYEQSQNQLCDGYGYCCLGVALCTLGVTSDVMRDNEVPIHLFDEDEQKKYPDLLFDDRFVDIVTSKNDGMTNLSNPEGREYTFTEIADWIEENVEGV